MVNILVFGIDDQSNRIIGNLLKGAGYDGGILRFERLEMVSNCYGNVFGRNTSYDLLVYVIPCGDVLRFAHVELFRSVTSYFCYPNTSVLLVGTLEDVDSIVSCNTWWRSNRSTLSRRGIDPSSGMSGVFRSYSFCGSAYDKIIAKSTETLLALIAACF